VPEVTRLEESWWAGGLEIFSRVYVDTLPGFGVVQQADEGLERPAFILHE
jgi:hypothetical protein